MKLKGLNIRKNKVGTWYVSLRSTGQQLAKAKDREELDRLLASPDFLHTYASAERKRRKTYDAGTFGALVDAYKSGRSWTGLAPRTKADYDKVLLYLEDIFPVTAEMIETIDIVEARDEAAKAKGDKFSDFVLAVMSAVFRDAVEAGKLKSNPVKGVRRLYKVNTDANRRWTDDEWKTASAIMPAHLLPVLAIARHCGLRGQDIARLTWQNYRADPDMGMVLAFQPRKNGQKVGEITIGVPPALRSLLDAMRAGDGKVQPASNAPICRNSLGKAYPNEGAMRGAWQTFKTSESFRTALPKGGDLTLHGLRVTFASELREAGFSDREVADMLGDMSEGMGKRYSRGAEMRKTSVRVFQRRLENSR